AILVAQPLDYENCRDYFLTVEAHDGGTPPLSSITTLNIILTDVNDNAPVFSHDLYNAVLPEDSMIGQFVVQERAALEPQTDPSSSDQSIRILFLRSCVLQSLTSQQYVGAETLV
ncbi:hypothetical protein AMECASPLE_028403, partial [Ameca splendens]